MIRTISTLLKKTAFLSHNPRRFFCSKADALKTYLEIIPPHRIYQLRQQKEHRVQNALLSLQQQQSIQGRWIINENDLNTIYKQVKRRTNMLPVPVLTRIAQLCCKHQDGEYSIQLKKMYSKIVRTVKNNAEKLPLEDMIDLVYRLAKLNRREHELMKEVQKVIVEDRIKIDFPLIRKILFTYTHLNLGSAVLYSHISKTLTIGQHQFRPIELAEAAYMLSKVSQNAKGGFGVFAIVQKQLQAMLPRMAFTQLVKASSFMLTQDLGSNKFQHKLEEALYNTYPSKDRIKINDFVALLKSTSGYYFKFKEGAILSLLKTTTLRMTRFATLQQLQDIVWSWGRLGKGDKQVWQCLQTELSRHLPALKPRQIAFAYYALCSTNNTTTEILRLFQQRFIKLPLQEINEHYIIKFLLGMHRKKLYEHQIFTSLSEAVSNRIQTLSNTQFVSFLKILNESDLDYDSKASIQGVFNSINKFTSKLQSKLYVLKLTEVCQLLFLLVKFQIQNAGLIEKCLFNIDNVIDIPKSGFIKAMFSFTIKERYNKVLECIPIIQQLTKYGPIGYFFSPYEFPLLAYSLFNLEVNGTNVNINRKLLQQTQQALNQINPIILNQFTKKGYGEAKRLIEVYHKREQLQ